MALSRNMKRIGMAAYAEKRDQRDQIEWQESQARKAQEAHDVLVEMNLMRDVIDKYGDTFTDWYDSPAVPHHGFARDRIRLIEDWVAQQQAPSFLEGVTAPVLDYVQDNRVVWKTDDPPGNYRAIWNDDDPDGVKLKPAAQESETG